MLTSTTLWELSVSRKQLLLCSQLLAALISHDLAVDLYPVPQPVTAVSLTCLGVALMCVSFALC